MNGDDKQLGAVSPGVAGASSLFEPLRAALREVAEPERYRLLASFLSELADQSGSSSNRQGLASKDEIDALAKKAQALDEQRAGLEDAIKTTRADLARAEKQLEAEQTRAKELQGIIDDQKARLESMPNQLADLEAELVAKNAGLHKAHVRNDELTLRLQRAEFATQDRSQADALEQDKGRLSDEAEELKAQLEQLRLDKDGEITRVQEELRKAQSVASQGGDAVLSNLWDRLASADPPLTEGHVPPNVQAAERLVDAFLELMRFVDGIDKGMRPFLGRFTQDHPSVKVPWDAFARGDDLYTIAHRTVAPKGGKPVGILKMRLRLLYSWIHAAMLGCDSAVESVASEVHSHLRDSSEWDYFKSTIREYDRADGPEKLQERIRKVCSEKLAEAFGRGG